MRNPNLTFLNVYFFVRRLFAAQTVLSLSACHRTIGGKNQWLRWPPEGIKCTFFYQPENWKSAVTMKALLVAMTQSCEVRTDWLRGFDPHSYLSRTWFEMEETCLCSLVSGQLTTVSSMIRLKLSQSAAKSAMPHCVINVFVLMSQVMT